MPKECVSISATSDLHTYFLRRSAIKFSFLLKKKTTHKLSQTKQDFSLCEDPPAKGDGTQTRTGVVFLSVIMEGGATVQPRTPDLQPAYSTAPVLPDQIIKSLEENLILYTPPPTLPSPPPPPPTPL